MKPIRLLTAIGCLLLVTGCTERETQRDWSDHAVVTWAEKLSDPDPWVRAGAADALGRLGAEAAGTSSLLLERLQADDAAEVRARCARALGAVGAGEAKQLLLRLLQGPEEEEVRVACAESLVALGAGDELLQLLLAALDARPDSATLGSLANGFAAVGAPAVPPLRKRLSPAAPKESRTSVALCLGAIGEPARAAVIELKALLEESEDRLRLAAILALGSIGGAEACHALGVTIQSDPSASLQLEAVIAGAESCDFAPVEEPSAGD